MSIEFINACICYFPLVRCSPVKIFCVTKMVCQMRYFQFLWNRKTDKSIPKLILASYVIMRSR